MNHWTRDSITGQWIDKNGVVFIINKQHDYGLFLVYLFFCFFVIASIASMMEQSQQSTKEKNKVFIAFITALAIPPSLLYYICSG